MTDGILNLDQPVVVEENSPQGFRKYLGQAGWAAFGLACLIIFTLFKLPEDRIVNLIQGNISATLATRGITINAAKNSFSVLFGPSYIMKDVTLSFPPPQASAHIDKVEFAPSLLPLLLGKMGGTFQLYNGDGRATISFSAKETKIDADFKIRDLDLGKSGILDALAQVKGNAIANGSGNLSGDLASPGTLDGDISFTLKKIVLDQQSIAGFAIPRINVSEGKAEIAIGKSKAQIKTLTLGKTGNASDDLHATMTGDMTLGRNWDSSVLNLRANFSLSQNVMSAFSILDALLGAGKQPDGSYTYTINGPMAAPIANPVAAGGH
jgi:type II secretion system protein N